MIHDHKGRLPADCEPTTPAVDRAFRYLSKLPVLTTANAWSKQHPCVRKVPLMFVDMLAPSIICNKIKENWYRIWRNASKFRPLLYETPNRL